MSEKTWEELWQERVSGLETVFGKSDEGVWHSPLPFYLGGDADVIAFSGFGGGKLYVTCELVGSDEQPPNSRGQYELGVVHPPGEEWGAGIICRLARYTLEMVIDDQHTMDIGPATPDDSTIAAFLFRRIADFTCFGEPANVICCVGITQDEFDFGTEHGAEALIQALGCDYYLTDLRRPSRL